MPRFLTGKRLIGAIVIILLVGSLIAWTLSSPVPLQVQSESMLSSSILQYAKVVQRFTITDGGGSYTFAFGVAYNENVTAGEPFIVDVYALLVSSTLASGFQRGVALRLQHATVQIDGVADAGIKVRTTYSSSVASFYLTYLETNSSSGKQVITVRLILQTIDVNYIGYLSGTTQLVQLNATVNVV